MRLWIVVALTVAVAGGVCFAEEPAKRPARKAAGKATPRAGRPRKTSTTPTEE